MNFQEMGYLGVDWIDLFQGRAGDWLLLIRQWTFRLHEVRAISLIDEGLLACKEGLCNVNVSYLVTSLVTYLVRCGAVG